MTLTGHLLPLGFVVLLWFGSTGLVAWLDNRPRVSFGVTLGVAGLLALVGLIAIFATAESASPRAAYLAFVAAFLVWGWHELAFLTGRVTGPRKAACPPGARGFRRLKAAVGVVAHHELALFATLLLLILLCWGATNFVAVYAFAILLGMRLSAKLNIFLGVPNFDADMLPPQLAYLRTYFRQRPFNALMPFSLAAGIALTGWLGLEALAAQGNASIGWSLLAGLALLGIVEHLFLVLPFRDGALWRWALPSRA